MGEMMEMYLKALAARNAEAVGLPQVKPGGLKEVPKIAVAKEQPKQAPAPIMAVLDKDVDPEVYENNDQEWWDL